MSIHMNETPSPLESMLNDQQSELDSLEIAYSATNGEAPEYNSIVTLGTELAKRTKDFKQFMSYYSCAIMEVQTKFGVLNEEFSMRDGGNPIESIRTRLKSPESLAGKLQRKNIPPTFEAIEENIYDIAGIRVVCSFIEDIYTLADCILEQDDITLVRKKDYIANPKPNGYRGLHLIVEIPIFLSQGKRMVKVEIQLRTIAMDFWASLEHKLRYKKNLDGDTVERISGRLKWAAETAAVLDCGM
ncbi:MAG: GTP pyrophosphokinase family protein, partial [Eggerthellaceae bacterium]